MVLNAPPDHWSHRHPRFLAASMFIFDRQADRLRLKVDGEYTRYLRLCRQLFSDILTNRTITLKEFVWDHILQDPSSLVPIIHTELPLITEVRLSTLWSRFTPQAYRLAYQDVHISPHKFQKATIHHFWYSKSYPNARTVFYRTIHHRIPTQVFIHKYNSQILTCCSLCGEADDTIRHFTVDCPKKWEIWTKVLHQFFPHNTFSAEMVYGVLCFLHIPRFVRKKSVLCSIISTTHWQLWNLYWNHGNSNPRIVSPTTLEQVYAKTISLIDTLLHQD